ncbi:MAG TPA: hypothetical protein PLB41_04685 [Rubrivivax sp.]|nr:hypothetical protein [Rubrivivax sp.]HPO18567.1 hypothetical protein [Rubrivivax sp.]
MGALPSTAPAGELEAALARIETRVAALGEALRTAQGAALADEAAALQRALAALLPLLRSQPGVPSAALRRRVAHCAGQVGAQREALARAAAVAARALELLLPDAAPRAGYSARGLEQRHAGRGALQA